ncbi:hypothetical protein LAZ67_6002005 [Cordylochernes scorpioides]|uniref:Mos1 transposase HTH domain-containing protein n=1 Tax=Cordylochernes scorpioides TaxID=51811 RepID=A0ABY6KK64_9ARAC|nr:hypothetical protein LAZ67_6002005 [Cordylochernes scorpioides]
MVVSLKRKPKPTNGSSSVSSTEKKKFQENKHIENQSRRGGRMGPGSGPTYRSNDVARVSQPAAVRPWRGAKPWRALHAILIVAYDDDRPCSATETYELIKEVFGEAALSRSRTFEWFSRFLKGREKVNDDQHTGRPRSLRCEENKLKKGIN